jgi:hypothetical protein
MMAKPIRLLIAKGMVRIKPAVILRKLKVQKRNSPKRAKVRFQI